MRVYGDMPVDTLIHCDDESNDELTHWGIKGMRWGVRRYQNKDGSLTTAGKRKLKAESDKLKEEERVLKNRKATKAKFDRLAAKKKALEDQKKELDDAGNRSKKGKTEDTKSTKKSVKDMTDEELITAINRKRLEDTYNQMHPEPVKKGNSFVKDFWDKSAVPAIQEAGKGLIKDSLTKLGKKYLGLNTEQTEDYVTRLGKEVKKMTLEKQYKKLKEEFEAEAAKAAAKEASKNDDPDADTSNNRQKNHKDDDGPEVIEGEFVGGGRRGQQWTKTSAKKTTDDIIDAEFEDITPRDASNYPATQTGRSYIQGLLPAPKKDDD